MIHSMTAFSRQESKAPWGTLSWELRSVNHRYLEILPRLPESLRNLENPVRERLRQALSRGKVECNLKLTSEANAQPELSINEDFVKQLLQANRQIQALNGNQDALANAQILQWPGVLQNPEIDFDEIQSAAMSLLDTTLQAFIDHRQREGAALKQIIISRLDAIGAQIATAKENMPAILAAQKERLTNKIAEAQIHLDADRLEQEIVYITQKADIDEELDRLNTHVKEVHHSLNKGGPCGRRLDFLMQELNREANTLGSKSLHVVTTQVSVELKVLIEQMREQIQNIE